MKEIKPFTADEYFYDNDSPFVYSDFIDLEGRNVGADIMKICEFAEAYHREKMKETLNSILEDMDCTSVEYHHEIVEEYLEELTQKIKGD